MGFKTVLSCLSLLIFFVDTTASSDTSERETLLESLRNPRVTGRIVKLYSGNRPEPVQCPDEGFQLDPADCTVFYRCVKGANNKFTVFRFQCGPGTVYDPDTEVCNYPRSTRRAECGGLVPSNEKNNENEIVQGVQQELPSPISMKPVYPETSANKITTAYPWATSPAQFTQSSSASNINQFTTTSGNKISPSRQEGDACTSDGFMGDSKNCRKFYRCVGNQRGGFIRYEFTCSETTVWDDDAQSCNHPWAVQRSRCGRINLNADEKSSNTPDKFSNKSPITTQQQLQINYGDKVSQTQTQISHGQVIQNQTQINYGDRESKNEIAPVKQNQTQISHGSAVIQTQTQINHGNNAVQTQLQVDHSKEASQAQTQISETTSKTTTSSEDTDIDQGYGDSSDTGSQKPPSDIQGNKNECTESGFMGDKNDCSKFYRCVDNGRSGFIKYEFSCGEGTVWDSSIEACNHAWAVKECGGKAPSSSSTQNIPESTSSPKPMQTTQIQEITDENEDVGYGNQEQEKPSVTTTTQSNNIPTMTSSVPPSNTEGNVCTSSGFKGDPNDCSKFYRCVDNGKNSYTKYEFKCGEGTVWDPDIEACNHAWAVKRCGGGTTDVNKVESTTNSVVTEPLVSTTTQDVEDSGYGQQPVEPSPEESGSSMEPTEASQTNECTSSGFMGDNNDCKKFYRCVDSGNGNYIRYEFACGEGTVWDLRIDACNHAWAVEKCGGSGGDVYKETTTSARPTLSDEDGSTAVINENITDKPSSSSTTQAIQTTSRPSSGNECSQEGFMGDDTDCKKFYRCVDNGQGGFIKYEFSCGEGTVWDSEITSCNHESAVKKPCNTHVEENSSNGPEESTSESITQAVSSQNTDSQSSDKPSSSKPAGKECYQEGFVGDDNDCKKFYRCVDDGNGGFTKYEFTCGEGTVWDPEANTCNHPSVNRRCRGTGSQSDASFNPNDEMDSGSVTSETPAETEQNNTATESNSAATTSTQKPQSSSSQCSNEGFFGDENDCKKFYRCVDDGKGGYTKYEFVCGDGTIWDQEIQTCNHGDSSNCSKVNSNETQTSHPQSETSDGGTTTSSTESQLNTQATEASSSENCESEGFYPDPHDCRKFYRCVDNGKGGFTKYEFSCGEGTAWDNDVKSCNHINEVKSCNNQEIPPASSQNDETSQSSGTTTAESTTKTSTSGPSSESSKPSSQDQCTQEGYFGNTQDCTKFYRCVDNGKGGYTKYDFDCGEGTIWDQDVTTCNHPQDVKNPSCQQSGEGGTSNSDSSSTTSSTSSSESSSSSSAESSSESSDCSQGSTKKPGKNNVNCTEAGYYPDPDDCKKFYRCVDWEGDGKKFSVFHFTCGEGTIWDPALDTCNYEDSVYPPRDCSGSQSQNETVTEESSTDGETTTQKSTTEESATQESTTSQSTTEEQTTSEHTTTQQTTTSQSPTQEQTTTQQTTTQEHTTTEQEKTTTEQSNEQTTQQTTTTQTTEHTTHESTTQQSTEKTTTEGKEESTTQEQTTQQTTSQTEETGTTESTTTEGTTSSHDSTTTESEHESTTESQQQSTTESSHESTTESQQESTTEGNNETTTESTSSSSNCPETDDDQNMYVCPTSFKRHPKYCNMFYQCTEDDDTHDVQVATFRCPNNTIYDEKKVQCVEESKADEKCDGETAQKRRIKRFDTMYKEPLVITKERLKCPTAGHFPFEKEECSPAFLKCETSKSGKLRGYVYQCPQGQVYWSVSRRCERKSYLKDCKHSTNNNWTGRWEIPIERRNVAP